MKYLYDCLNCDTVLEVVRSIHDKEEVPICPDCGLQTSRIWEPAPVSFKGGGFYTTDSRGR